MCLKYKKKVDVDMKNIIQISVFTLSALKI